MSGVTDIFNLTDTWDDAEAQFTAIKMDVTKSAAAAGSMLLDLRKNGVTKFAVDEDGNITAGALAVAQTKSFFVPAAGIRPSSSGGCASLALVATSANQPDISSLDFDATTAEYAQFWVQMPKNWDEGTIQAAFVWSHASTATNFGVRWGIQAVAISDDDTIGVGYGTAQEVTDTGGTTNDLYISGNTSAITIAGTPQAEDWVAFRVYRLPTDAADTLAIDARLMGVKVYYGTNTTDEA